MHLTGNRDTDIIILLNLSLKDLRLTCQMNSYINQLCQTRALADKMTIAIKNVESTLEYADYYCVNKYLKSGKQLYSIINRIQIHNFAMDYVIEFYNDDELSSEIVLSRIQAKEFLLHLYYDNII